MSMYVTECIAALFIACKGVGTGGWGGGLGVGVWHGLVYIFFKVGLYKRGKPPRMRSNRRTQAQLSHFKIGSNFRPLSYRDIL